MMHTTRHLYQFSLHGAVFSTFDRLFVGDDLQPPLYESKAVAAIVCTSLSFADSKDKKREQHRSFAHGGAVRGCPPPHNVGPDDTVTIKGHEVSNLHALFSLGTNALVPVQPQNCCGVVRSRGELD